MWLAGEAERQGLVKVLKTGGGQPFTVSCAQLFAGFDDRMNFFSSRERIQLISGALLSLVPSVSDRAFGGLSLRGNVPLIGALTQAALITSHFPLHNEPELDALSRAWVGSWGAWLRPQPLAMVHSYLGERIALYFAFVEFYVRWLVAPACIGAALHFGGARVPYSTELFAIFLCVWSTAFLEAWRQQAAIHAYEWAASETTEIEHPRPQYMPVSIINPHSGEVELDFPWERRALRYAVTVPCTIVAVLASLAIMLSSFYAEDWLRGRHWGVALVPVFLYGIFLPLTNWLWKRAASFLTEYENHRLESEARQAMLLKVCIFQLVNCFSSLFYAAFFVRSIERLYAQLFGLLVTSQILFGTIEIALPYVMKLASLWRSHGVADGAGHTIVSKVDAERILTEYLTVYDDYMELVVQFGYLSLFAAVMPLAPLLALGNNILEIRSDASKLLFACRRPLPWRGVTLGEWWFVLQAISYLSVLTNTALVAIAWRDDHPDRTLALSTFVLFVAVEHVVFLLKALVQWVVPDRPGWLEHAIEEDRRAAAAAAAPLLAAAAATK